MALYPDPSNFSLRGWCSSLGVKGKGLCFALLFNYMYIYTHIQIHTLLLRPTPFYSTATDVTPPGVIRISGGKMSSSVLTLSTSMTSFMVIRLFPK